MGFAEQVATRSDYCRPVRQFHSILDPLTVMPRCKDIHHLRFLFIAIFLIGVVGCGDSTVVKNAVLDQGQSVEASNNNGTIRISYVSPTKRKYEWDGKSRTVKMIARAEAFQGRWGLYDPADSWGFSFSEVRMVVEESVRDFEDMEQLRAALVQSSAVLDWVYTSDGLVVGFGRTPSRKQINIDLFQLLVRGQKPSGLAGARPEQIRLIQSEGKSP